MKSVMLTGATGFIGSHIAEKLVEKGVLTHLLVRRRTDLLNQLEKRGARVHVANPDDLAGLKDSFRDADTIIHCAGTTRGLKRDDYIRGNVTFTENILSILGEPQRIVYISSQAVAGPSNSRGPVEEDTLPNPLTHYAESKVIAEDRVRDWGKQNRNNFVIIRPSAVYGPRERGIHTYFKLIKMGIFVLPVDGRNRFSIVHVEDLVEAVLKAAGHSPGGETYFVANDEPCTWEKLGKTIQEALKKTHVLKLPLPRFTQHIGPFFCDLISLISGKPMFMSSQKMIELKQRAWVCSNRKIKRMVGWKPKIPFEKGIELTANWYIKNNWI